MSNNRTGDHEFATTQLQRKRLVMDKLRWHLERKPDLTLAEIAELFKVTTKTAHAWRKSLKEGK